MNNSIRCSLVNYDGGSQALLQQYIRRAGCQESTLPTSPTLYAEDANPAMSSDLIFLHLSSPEESVQKDLATQLRHHQGVVITSPFPKQQFQDLFTEPFAFLTEPFSYAQFNKCLLTYCQTPI
ncbi:hypothetical protein [Spirosoma agri]|uniref:Response regulator n=1 Tax=Spirosoma agri TaxID=1987381 RepID=A0A6M0IQH3_9BACT|nr:hypothetical protein [Spirosoma agri]NEU69775.1 hypothetical protein [Spirosoma agri]